MSLGRVADSVLPEGHPQDAAGEGVYFIAAVHGDLIAESFGRLPDGPDVFNASDEALRFLREVQTLSDSRASSGDKRDGRLYLHHMAPPRDYAPEAHSTVLSELGVTGRDHATLDEFIAAAEIRAVREAAGWIRETGGALSLPRAGAIIYLLGTLFHAVQDEKHRDGNWFHGRDEAITSVEHFTSEFHQTVTDNLPSETLLETAVARGVALLARFHEGLRREVSDPTALSIAFAAMEHFRFTPGSSVLAYRPAAEVMERVFPVYPLVP